MTGSPERSSRRSRLREYARCNAEEGDAEEDLGKPTRIVKARPPQGNDNAVSRFGFWVQVGVMCVGPFSQRSGDLEGGVGIRRGPTAGAVSGAICNP